MKTLLLMGLLLMSGTLFAQQPIEIKVWPNGAPNDNGITEEKNGDTDSPSYTKETILYVYPAKKGNGMAIVACPGGGYSHLAMAHEGKSMADWFNSQGITYAVLRYRMPNGHNEVPLSDSQQALRIMRQHAQEWNVKKLGIMGSSAGGHLPAPQPLISPMRKPSGLPDSVLSGHHHGSCLHSHGFSRQPVGKESLKGTGTEIFQ